MNEIDDLNGLANMAQRCTEKMADGRLGWGMDSLNRAGREMVEIRLKSSSQNVKRRGQDGSCQPCASMIR